MPGFYDPVERDFVRLPYLSEAADLRPTLAWRQAGPDRGPVQFPRAALCASKRQ
jgi:hypothetical protein